MGEEKRCAACGKENPVSEMKVCMHQQMHRYVCDSKCMTDFYNQPKKPTAAELEAKVATLEAENAKLRAELERREVDGWKLVPVGADCVTSGMKSACIGEFSFGIQMTCGECVDCGAESDCPVCGGEVEYTQKITVPWDTCKEIYKAMLAAASSAPKADAPATVQGDGWIPVGERMPEVGQYLLVSGPRGEPGDGLYRMTGIMREDGIHDGYGCWLSDATHWMPLPAAPAIAAARKGEGE